MSISKAGVRAWFHNIFKYAFIVVILFLAYVAVFFSSYGVPPWDKFSATIGTLLLSIISMYFGYKIERQRNRRENEVRKFEDFVIEVGDLMEKVSRVDLLRSRQDDRELKRVWREIQCKDQELVDHLPSLFRISDPVTREALEDPWNDIKALLEVLNQITTETISKDTTTAMRISADMNEKLSLFRLKLINYEQTQ